MKKILITVYCLFIAALVGTAIYATSTFTGAVANSYEKGMQYPIDLAKLKEVGWQFSNIKHPLHQGEVSQIEFSVADRDGKPLRGASIVMEVASVSSLKGALHPEVTEVDGGRYVASITPAFYGVCRVDTRINFQENSLPYGFTLYIDKKGE